MNIREATTQWVNGFNAIPQSIIQKLIGIDWDEVKELTPPTAYDRVYTNSCKYGEIVKVSNADDDLYLIRLDDSDKKVEMHGNDFTVIHDDLLPMWGTMWSFGDSADNWWLERGGIETMANCGFRIYEQEDFEYIFGIDGAGYDFYEEHWIPLYKARGLRWHSEESETTV